MRDQLSPATVPSIVNATVRPRFSKKMLRRTIASSVMRKAGCARRSSIRPLVNAWISPYSALRVQPKSLISSPAS
jgi:hypothetical protein